MKTKKRFGFLVDHIKDPFKRYLLLAIVIVAVIAIARDIAPHDYVDPMSEDDEGVVHYFFLPTCPHCAAQKPFNEQLMKEFGDIAFVYHDISESSERELILSFGERYSIPREQLAVPATFIGEKYTIGFDTAETTGVVIREHIVRYRDSLHNESRIDYGNDEESESVNSGGEGSETLTIDLPVFGTINVLDYSLPVLAILLGFIDGFNPCAMWVLVYLISLIVTLNDRRKIWLLVGSFVAASGILYFLFMTAWLNVFLLIGFLKPVTLIIGLWALYVGASDLKTYFTTKGALVCEVGDAKSKSKTLSRIEKIVHSPLSFMTVFAIIGLAFIINSIEFVCSAAIPAIFTQVLAISNLSTLQYYGYILLYDIFFMIDDLIIFSLAVFAINSSVGQKYAKHCKLIGGVVLFGLGVLLVFAPNLLG